MYRNSRACHACIRRWGIRKRNGCLIRVKPMRQVWLLDRCGKILTLTDIDRRPRWWGRWLKRLKSLRWRRRSKGWSLLLLLLLLWCMRKGLGWLLLLLMLLLLLVLVLVLVPLMVSVPESSPPEPAARDTTSKSIRTSPSAPIISSTLVVPTIRTTTWAPSVRFTFWVAIAIPVSFSHEATLTRRHHGMTCPACASEPITKVLDFEPVSTRTRQRLGLWLMDGVWA